VDVRLAAAHPGAEVPPDWPEDGDGAVRHVLAAVVADPLDDRVRARVPHREPLARATGAEELAAGRAVQNGVPDQHGVAGVALGRADRDPAAAHPLADVVVRLADQVELDARGEERPEALPRRAREAHPDPARRRVDAEAPPDLAAEARSDGAVPGRDRVGGLDERRALERRLGLAREPLAELAAAGERHRLALVAAGRR